MKEAHARISRIKRLAAAVGAVCLLAALGAPPAAAELGLPELGLPEANETLAETTTPVLEPVQQTQLLPATVETLAGVTESVGAPVAEELPAIEAATQSLLQQTLPTLEPVVETTAPVLGALDGTPATDAPSTESARLEETVSVAMGEEPAIVAPVLDVPFALAPTSSDRDKLTASTRRAPGIALADTGPSDFAALPSLPGSSENTTTDSGGAKASPAPPSIPAPFAPSGPLSGLASASASAGAGALMLLLAALAAALVLAAPGLGRRLRPTLAPWLQPILPLSLERPG